jgi:hypothetical protein
MSQEKPQTERPMENKGGRNGERRSPQEREARRAEFVARNLDRAKDPRSIIIIPRTLEGYLMCRMADVLNRSIYRLRSQAGASVSMADTINWLKRVDDLGKAFATVLKRFGIQDLDLVSALDDAEPQPVREALAGRENAQVLLPRTDEGRTLVHAIKRLDGALVSVRLVSVDLTKQADSIAQVTQLVRELNELTTGLAEKAGVRYTPPRRMDKLEAA